MTEPQWHPCCEGITLPEGRMTEVRVAGKRICLLRRSGSLHAFAAACPHAGAPLCDGRIDVQGRIVCPLHGYRFNPANGYNASGEGYKLRTYPAKEEAGCIFVQF